MLKTSAIYFDHSLVRLIVHSYQWHKQRCSSHPEGCVNGVGGRNVPKLLPRFCSRDRGQSHDWRRRTMLLAMPPMRSQCVRDLPPCAVRILRYLSFCPAFSASSGMKENVHRSFIECCIQLNTTSTHSDLPSSIPNQGEAKTNKYTQFMHTTAALRMRLWQPARRGVQPAISDGSCRSMKLTSSSICHGHGHTRPKLVL